MFHILMDDYMNQETPMDGKKEMPFKKSPVAKADPMKEIYDLVEKAKTLAQNLSDEVPEKEQLVSMLTELCDVTGKKSDMATAEDVAEIKPGGMKGFMNPGNESGMS